MEKFLLLRFLFNYWFYSSSLCISNFIGHCKEQNKQFFFLVCLCCLIRQSRNLNWIWLHFIFIKFEHVKLLHWKMLKLFPRKQAQFFYTKYPSNLSKMASFSSPPHHLNLTKAILNSRTPQQALILFNSNAKLLNPLKNLEPYSAIIHVLAGAKLYTNARCLIKYLIKTLQSSSKPHRACHLIFDALNRLQTSKFTLNVFGSIIDINGVICSVYYFF